MSSVSSLSTGVPHLPRSPLSEAISGGREVPLPAIGIAVDSPAALPQVGPSVGLPHVHRGRRGGGCPAFTRPDEYMALREGGLVLVHLKRFFERRAISRCLEGLDDIASVADVPCGPGRLFPYWRRRGLAVVGIDCSPPMVVAAAQQHAAMGLRGEVVQGDAFRLTESLPEPPDLVASVRFCYYFGRDQRLALLRSLSAASRRYVLAQYKTGETLRGRKCRQRSRNRHGDEGKKYCSYAEMREEFAQAGLVCLGIQPIGPWSDRVFVIGRKA